MPSPNERYLVGPREPGTGIDVMSTFLEALQHVEGAAHVAGDPHRYLVVHLSPEALERLNRRFGAALIIEPDAPLSL